LAGNIANASPIADMSAMLIALGASVSLVGGKGAPREVPLEEFFVGYKKLDMLPDQRIRAILLPAAPVRFNFEKVSKRARLDIASVNTAMAVTENPDGSIASIRYSAGGIAAVPLRLKRLEELLRGKKPDAALARLAGSEASASGTPMDDVRGSSAYRKRLMERLAWAHFIRLWPELRLEEELLA
jgi:xanthine dehydrogenase small subunit